MATQRRSTAYIEPEFGGDEKKKGWLLPLILGIAVGLVLGAFALGNQYVIELYISDLEARYAALDEEMRKMTLYGGVALVGLLLAATKLKILFNAALWGVAIGVFLWVPFGNHMMAYLPEIEEQVPGLRQGLDDVVEGTPQLAQIRSFAESNLEVPPKTQ